MGYESGAKPPKAFFTGFRIFIAGILITGILIRSTEDLLVIFVLFITSLGVTSLMVSIA